VPGAFMSMIGASLLDQIVLNEHETEPSEILTKIHEGIVKLLNQEHSENKDGMDAAICTIDLNKDILYFAEAKRPLVYIEKNAINSIKGTVSGIGGIYGKERTQKEFITHKIDTKNKRFYIFSDGYSDQFGGVRNREYLQKRLMNTLLATSKFSFEKQCKLIDKELIVWQGDIPQTDDILIVGFSN